MSAHGGNVEVLAPQYGFAAGDVLDFSANINPYGPPPGTGEILENSWKDISRYPDPHSTRLRAALALWHDVDPKNITAANGASELIFWIARLFPAPGARVFAPAFTEYAAGVLAAGGKVRYEIAGEKDGWCPSFRPSPPDLGIRGQASDESRNPSEIDSRSTSRVVDFRGNDGNDDDNLVFLANPNNPTGALIDPSSLKTWIEKSLWLSPETIFVLDESFLPFAGDESLSLSAFAARTPGVIILRSLTKILSVPGLRLGYSIAESGTARRLESLLPAWRVNILAQRFGEKILGFSEFVQSSRTRLALNRESLRLGLRDLSFLKAFESSANFLLLKLLSPDLDSERAASALARKGIWVRSCNDFAGLEPGRFLRAAVRTPEENAAFLQALRETL